MGKLYDTITDALAICAINQNTIIVGKGRKLHLYTLTNAQHSDHNENIVSKPLNVEPLTIYNIHGIETSSNANLTDNSQSHPFLLVYGGREFLVATFINRSDELEFIETYRANLTDWIITARILESKQHHEFVLLTAHSVILRFKCDRDQDRKYSLLERVSCNDKSILYCSKISGTMWQELVVFSGNAFGEVLIWQPNKVSEEKVGETKLTKRSPLLQRFPAHKGVVFSLDYDKAYGLLVTTSDDRSTKWFQIKFPDINQQSWTEAHIQPVMSVFGHGARVFKGCAIGNVQNNDKSRKKNALEKYYILSVGEDSCLCVWDVKGRLIHKRHQQHGAIIWNFIYMKESQTVFTVGSAGNLIGYDLSAIFANDQNNESDMIALLPQQITTDPGEYMAKIRFLDSRGNIIIGITNYNRIFCLDSDGKDIQMISEEDSLHWIPWNINVDFKCTVFEIWNEQYCTLIALCGYSRLIILENSISSSILANRILYNGKLPCSLIRSFIFLSRDDYVVGDNSGQILLIQRNGGETYNLIPICSKFKCKERDAWPIAALHLNYNLEIEKKELLLISTRQGHLILYTPMNPNPDKQFIEKACIKQTHGNLGATCIHLHCETNNEAIVYSLGRNNTIIWYKIDLILSDIRIINMERIPVCWTAALISQNDGENLMILGFNDNHLVAWTRNLNILWEFPCGGGYRSWHYCSLKMDDGRTLAHLKVIYVKAKKVYMYKMPLYNKSLMVTTFLVRKWHTAACNAIECITDANLIVTAGEDNLIKICQLLNDSSGQLQICQNLHCHISTIKTMKLVNIRADTYILFSGGGRGQLCITHIVKSNKQYHIEQLLSHILTPLNEEKCIPQSYNYSTDVRIMSMDILMTRENSEHYFGIYLGCSDGTVRCLHYHLQDNKLIQENTDTVIINYKRCVLHVRTISSINSLITSTTDGKLKFYNLNDMSEVYEMRKPTKSAVTALSVHYHKDLSMIQILCGGDDQSITYSEYLYNTINAVASNDSSSPLSERKYLSRHDLHGAQVTGVTIESNGLYGFSAGVDRIIHQLDLHNDCAVLRSFRSSIADIKGITLLMETNHLYCLIFGNGLQIYTIV